MTLEEFQESKLLMKQGLETLIPIYEEKIAMYYKRIDALNSEAEEVSRLKRDAEGDYSMLVQMLKFVNRKTIEMEVEIDFK